MALREILDAYDAAWNEDDAQARRTWLRESLADDGVYCDPMVEVTGRDALAEYIEQSRSAYGRFRMETSGHDGHHGYVRFAWRMESEKGDLIVDGFDVVRTAADGRLQSIVGFFGPFPER